MARAEAAVYSILSASAGVTAIVASRIYPVYLPQDCVLPALTYFRVSTVREGAFQADPGYATVRIQISSWATSALSAGTLADSVRSALHRYVGTAGGVAVRDCSIEEEQAIYDPDTETHQIAQDYMLGHTEAT